MEKEKLKGIGGWLIIPTISLVLTGLIYGGLTIIFALILLIDGTLLDLVFVLILGGFSYLAIYTFILELKHRKSFVNYMKVWLWGSVVIVLFLSFIDGDYSDIVGAIVFATVWTWYLEESKRIRNTFIKLN